MRVGGKKAIVTGAGGGLGRAIALKLAEEGANIALVDISLKAAEKVEQELTEKGYRAISIKTDVSSESDVRRMVDTVREKLGGIDILVNNAGISKAIPFQEVSLESWNEGIDINLTGTFLCSKMVIGDMMEKEYGKIVNISSIAGQTARPVAADYSASKHGVIGLTRNLALQVAHLGINVNAVAPGPILTPIFEKDYPEEVIAKVMSSVPFKRKGRPEDVANAVLFLASDESGWITGEVIAVNGGAFMG